MHGWHRRSASGNTSFLYTNVLPWYAQMLGITNSVRFWALLNCSFEPLLSSYMGRPTLSMKFSGFTSRWMTPLLWQCCKTCSTTFMTRAASHSVNDPLKIRCKTSQIFCTVHQWHSNCCLRPLSTQPVRGKQGPYCTHCPSLHACCKRVRVCVTSDAHLSLIAWYSSLPLHNSMNK